MFRPATATATAITTTTTLLALVCSTIPASSAFAEPTATACIAVMLPSVQGAEGSATDIGNGIRDLFSSFLNGPAIKTIALEARLESQALEEATQKGCPRVLVTTVTMKHGGGLMSKAIGQGLSAAAWHAPIPVGSIATAAVRSAVMGGAQTVSTLASSTHARDEMQIEYRLAPDQAMRTEKAKAKNDREDLLTPLAERIAKALLASVTKP